MVEMDKEKTQQLVDAQRAHFRTGATQSLAARRQALTALRAALLAHEQDIYAALKADLNRPEQESYFMEFMLVMNELDYMLRHLKSICRRKRVHSPIEHFWTTSYIYQEPYGVCLIISPWNYPFQLTFVPLIGALACGNCAMVKPSEYTPACAEVIEKILNTTFDARFVAIARGGREANQFLLDQQYDYIFFTGSYAVGQVVMRAAAEHLTPLTLELGGKSPCLVDETADIEKTARRIAWGKLVNAGQTCVAPDYVLVHESKKQQLVDSLARHFAAAYGEHPETNPDYPAIVNQKHFDRLLGLYRDESVTHGGGSDAATRQIAPVILDNAARTSPAMQEEIFGPVLPVLSYADMETAIAEINAGPKPLAFYYFTGDIKREKDVMNRVHYGGGCVNDTLIHVAIHTLPFGGVGASGMGSYHGQKSIETFSHHKGVARKSLALDLPLRFHPYTKGKYKLVRFFTGGQSGK